MKYPIVWLNTSIIKKMMTPSPINIPPKKAGIGVKLAISIIIKLFL